MQNPAFYGITSLKDEEINSHLTNIISAAVLTLERSQCLVVDEVFDYFCILTATIQLNPRRLSQLHLYFRMVEHYILQRWDV